VQWVLLPPGSAGLAPGAALPRVTPENEVRHAAHAVFVGFLVSAG
jgi:hypothetical protein